MDYLHILSILLLTHSLAYSKKLDACDVRNPSAKDCSWDITSTVTKKKDLTISRATITCSVTYNKADDDKDDGDDNREGYVGSSCIKVMPGTNLIIKDSTITGKNEPNVRFMDAHEATILLKNVSISKFGQRAGNSGHFWGGALRGTDSQVEIVRSKLTGNSASIGGAIVVKSSELRISSSEVSDNHVISQGRAGGIYAGSGSVVEMMSVKIKKNSAEGRFGGGGMRLSRSNATFINVAVKGNIADDDTDISCGSGVYITADKSTKLSEDRRLIDPKCNIAQRNYTGFLCIPSCRKGETCIGMDKCGTCTIAACSWMIAMLLCTALWASA